MEKHTAIRMLPGSRVIFRGRLHEVVSLKSAGGMDAPYFRLRNLEQGTPTDLVSYKLLENPQLRDEAIVDGAPETPVARDARSAQVASAGATLVRQDERTFVPDQQTFVEPSRQQPVDRRDRVVLAACGGNRLAYRRETCPGARQFERRALQAFQRAVVNPRVVSPHQHADRCVRGRATGPNEFVRGGFDFAQQFVHAPFAIDDRKRRMRAHRERRPILRRDRAHRLGAQRFGVRGMEDLGQRPLQPRQVGDERPSFDRRLIARIEGWRRNSAR